MVKICSLAKVTTKRDRRERNVISESKYPISVTRLEIREPPLKWLPAFISVEPRNAISPRVSFFSLSLSFPQTYSPLCPPFSSSSFDLWFVEASPHARRLPSRGGTHLHNTSVVQPTFAITNDARDPIESLSSLFFPPLSDPGSKTFVKNRANLNFRFAPVRYFPLVSVELSSYRRILIEK